MKKVVTVIALLAALLLAGCAGDTGTYNNALDADREAREKLNSAMAAMKESEALVESTDENSEALAAQKASDAADALAMALASWENADTFYQTLMKTSPHKADFFNNYGNMLTFRLEKGLDVDIETARAAIAQAIEMNNRLIYQRNLKALEALETDADKMAEMAENRRLIAAIQGKTIEEPVIEEAPAPEEPIEESEEVVEETTEEGTTES
jgi:hypothetical protein